MMNINKMILNVNSKIYEFEIIDTLEYITMADSFVKNKIGKGHGEAKLYVGNENDRTCSFFENMNNLNCFFLKKDFWKFLIDAEDEYLSPQQEYIKKYEMPVKLSNLKNKCKNMGNDLLTFHLDRVPVNPPRVYMNSNSEYYDFMREISLPNISYLSILKLRNLFNGKILYYFKIFIDYKPDIVGYQTSEEIKEENEINKKDITNKQKERLIKSRIGQGEYRSKLLEECPFCPFTMVNDERLLIASHIKPWAKSNDEEKIDSKNGFIFTPTYDRLFDRGFITFKDDKTLIVSPWLSPMNQKRLGIYTGMLVERLNLDNKRIEYLRYHRENIFKS